MRHQYDYQQITDEEVENPVEDNEVVTADDSSAVGDREKVEYEGWRSLIWSFVSSGFLAVRFDFFVTFDIIPRISLQFVAYFFPVIFAIPVLGDHIARKWLWFFSPSLSYVGQGRMTNTLLC